MTDRPSALPDSVAAYNQSPVFTQDTVPAALLHDHATKEGVWGVLHVISGTLTYNVPSTGEKQILDAGATALIYPAVPHRVAPMGEVSFYIEFWK